MTIKDQIKDLELQVDHIIGYKPSGHPWKSEYLLRRSIIEHYKDNTTLQTIQTKLEELYKKQPHKQGYLRYTIEEHTNVQKTLAPIKLNQWENGERKTILLERG